MLNSYKYLLLAVTAIVWTGLNALSAQSIIRGPYLQNATDSAITVKWRTDSLSNSRLRYGHSPGNLTQVVTDSNLVYDHTVRIKGLLPYTQYYYAAGADTMDLEGDDSLHWFRTNPVPGTVQPVKAWIIGDFGRGNTYQYWVRDQYAHYRDSIRPADVWIWLGDNAYDIGSDLQYSDNVFKVYDTLFSSQVLWPTPGNHDYLSVNQSGMPPAHTGPYYSIVEVPTNGEAGGIPSGGEMYYSFDYGNVHFISLNSELGSWLVSNNTPLTQWLTADLMATQQPWKVLYFHQPPHSKGSHDTDNFWEVTSTAMRMNIMPIAEQHGVDLVLCGHSHVYERSKLLHGFYNWSYLYNPTFEVDGGSGQESLGEAYFKDKTGPNANRGTVYATVGNSGSISGGPQLNHPAMYYSWGCDTCVGSMILDVMGDTLRASYYSSMDSVLDNFTIIKRTIPLEESPWTVLEGSFRVWPNPFSRHLEVEFELAREGKMSLQVTDMEGREVFARRLGKLEQGKHRFTLDEFSGEAASGMYIVQLSGGVGAVSRRVVKMNNE
jgi:acid phosphatase type 7